MLVLYMTAVMNIQGRAKPENVHSEIMIVTYTFNLITPVGNLVRALFVALNLFSTLCSGSPPKLADYPGAFGLYGGPITYLIGQVLFLFGLILLWDHGFQLRWFKRSAPTADEEDNVTREPEVTAEIQRATSSNDGLRAVHISKGYKTRAAGAITAVDDVTFGVKKGEMFALVGPNGAGKSTTIGMLRGDIQPSRKGGEIYIDGIEIGKERKTARARLGVCPQFDAVDQMTVMEHLEFYAGIRGVGNARNNARQIVKAVGLERFADRMAEKLSGGNKRKLSLGIALIGNPEVVLLDEPSSGMDPLAKRVMWRTLTRFVPGRSVLLTTHSMEEADHLADRVGVIATRMLDVGDTGHLREKHGHGFHVQLIAKSAPHTTEQEIERIKQWMMERYPSAELEGTPYHGQMRFNIPAGKRAPPHQPGVSSKQGIIVDEDTIEKPDATPSRLHSENEISVGTLFVALEENKDALGVQFYSVSPSTFDEVFLRVVAKHNVGEEDSRTKVKKDGLAALKKLFRRRTGNAA